MSDVSNEFIDQLNMPKVPQVDNDVLLQYMEQQAREQLKSSLVSVITDHLMKEHNKESLVSSLKDSLMEQAVGNQDNSLIKEFKDIEIQDVDDVTVNFRKLVPGRQPDMPSFSLAESRINQSNESRVHSLSFRADQF